MVVGFEFREDQLVKAGTLDNANWIHEVEPSQDDLAELVGQGISLDMLSHSLDLNERPRMIQDNGVTFVVIHFPLKQPDDAAVPYKTVPVSIYLTEGRIFVVEPVLVGLKTRIQQRYKSAQGDAQNLQVLLSLFVLTAADYSESLRRINESIEDVEHRLQSSLRNREVLQLLNYQKSLVLFSTAINATEAVLEKLQKAESLPWSDGSKNLLQDSLVEIRQVMYQVEIAQNILTQMMDAFASIVSNNLNTVMKFLAAVTIIISIPMLIASLYGMNVPLPGEQQANAYVYILAVSLLLSLIVVLIFRDRDWL